MSEAVTDTQLSPFLAFLGARCQCNAQGEIEYHLQLQAQHLNAFGCAHGGLIQTLNDAAMAHTARALHQGQKAVLTLQMQTYFLQADARQGAELIVKARVLHQSLTMAVCEAECFHGGQLIAKSSGQFKFTRLR